MFNRLKSLVSTPTSSVPSTPGDQTPPALPSGGQTSPQLPGTFRAPLPKPEHLAALREAVPCAECDSCEDDEAELTAPDEEHYPSFPKKFDMDQESEMLGTCSASLLLLPRPELGDCGRRPVWLYPLHVEPGKGPRALLSTR